MDKALFTKDNIDNLLFQLAKEYKKINRKSGGGQMLICVGGRGFYQEEGKEVRELHPGDVVNIPANVKHWHGAAADSWFSHLAIEIEGEETSNEWCESVAEGVTQPMVTKSLDQAMKNLKKILKI